MRFASAEGIRWVTALSFSRLPAAMISSRRADGIPDSLSSTELVTGGLNQWRRSVQFIKEDDALFRIVRSRKKSGRTPLRASVFKTGKPSEIDGIEQNRADITQGHAAIRSDFGHNLAFAHARCAPEKYRLVSGKKRMER